MNKREKGFTLVELLVAITIIGLIASIVLIYLNTARGKGNDTKVRSQLNSARSSAEIYYNSSNSYNGTAGNISGPCDTVNSMFTDTISGMVKFTSQSNYPNGAALTCYSTTGAYAISALLPGVGGTNSWCVDSLNNSKARSTAINSTVC
ncbi:MAG: type II secretion system protein [bacterium]|nr:type II secretion system protein [bacterium]